MTAPTRPQRTTPPDPDGGTGGIHELLTIAVEEAARLLDADGAMVYLTDPATGNLRFAHDAGIRSERSREWVRGLDLAPGTGMFGRALVERAVVVTNDYRNDPSFRHAAQTDRVVEDIGIRSMVVAPLAAGDQVFGAMGTFSTRTDAFDKAQIALVRALADHAAAAMANTRLIEDLDRSRAELAHLAEVERTLREINARISAAGDQSSVLQLAVDEAARLLGADGSRIDLVDAESGLLRWAYASGAVKPDDEARYTSFIEEEKVTSALEAGASGYVLKDAEAEEVAAAVRAAHAGEVHLDPAVARLLAQRMRDRKSPKDELAEPLTEREKDVIRLLGQGMSNKDIGSTLFITERTARTYVSNILGKLGLASRTQAALYAVEHKLVDAPGV